MNGNQHSKPSLWQRFLRWLNEDKAEPVRLKFDLPKSHGDTDILLSHKQKQTLQDAVDTAFYPRETSFYSRDGGSRTRKGSGNDVII